MEVRSGKGSDAGGGKLKSGAGGLRFLMFKGCRKRIDRIRKTIISIKRASKLSVYRLFAVI